MLLVVGIIHADNNAKEHGYDWQFNFSFRHYIGFRDLGVLVELRGLFSK